MSRDRDFLHPDNVAGRNLLALVARGSAILTEMMRLADHIPPIFKMAEELSAGGAQQSSQAASAASSPSQPGSTSSASLSNPRYASILFDFRYFKSPELYDEKIDGELEYSELDEEFRDAHLGIIERFWKLFESIYRYLADLLTYLEELNEGVYVESTIESVLEEIEGGQLLAEAFYLYGAMLMIMDRKIPGDVRERLIVCYSRYKGAAAVSLRDEIVKLCRSTGFKPGKRPLNYPDEYFSRFKLPVDVISLIIAKLKADDIYNHTSAFPSPALRSMALAAQSSLIYVLLYFTPDLLHKKESAMREIVDKHFADNWVIPVYMGMSVDLADAWTPYKAATAALKNVYTKANVDEWIKKQSGSVPKLLGELDKVLTEGVLIEDYVLENIRPLVQLIRECNFALRWHLLHRTAANKKFRDAIVASVSTLDLMKLLMNASQFEWRLKTLFKRLLDLKETRWNENKKEVKERMVELSDYFSGTKELSRVKKNQSLQDWFKQLSEEVEALDFNNSILAGRKIATLNTALEEVQEFHQIDSSLQIKQFLGDCKEYLTKMIRTVNINQKVLGDLDIITDFSYAWEILSDYTPFFHEKIKADPSVCLLLRATFLKLSSILTTPLVRITQSGSADDVSVAEYFSSQLVIYVRGVLEIIPRSVFKVLDSIIALQTNQLKPLPTKLERKYLKEFSQLDERYSLARATHQVSVFTQGILSMSTTLLGIIKLDPRQLLEDGIRKELVRQTASAMNEYLVFRNPGNLNEFESRITELGRKLDGFKQSFEYIQDYIGIYGLKIWQEEISRVIHYNVEQECNSFLKKKIHDWQSNYQSEAIPIPVFQSIPPSKGQILSLNFMGRLARELITQTEPLKTVYSENLQGWYDGQSMREIVGIRTFSLLHRGVGIFGLMGLDQLISFMLVRELTDFVQLSRRLLQPRATEQIFNNITAQLHPCSQFPSNTQQLYPLAISKLSKSLDMMLAPLIRVGQIQLIRRFIANELNFTAKLDSKLLASALDNFNLALTTEVQSHYFQPDKPYPSNPIIPGVSQYLEAAGFNDPLTKIYLTTEPVEHLPLLLFLFTLQQTRLLSWSEKLCSLTCNKPIGLDGAALVTGLITVLKQFHSVHTHTYLSYLGQFVRANISANETIGQSNKLATELTPEVLGVLLFLEEYCKFSHTNRKAISTLIPPYIFDRFPHND